MIILGTNSVKDTGYDVANSCRFNDDDTAYMHKTPSSSGSQRTFTFSTWWKQGDLASSSVIFSSGESDGDPNFAIYYNSSQKLNVLYYEGSSLLQLITNAQYRDPSAWYHICVAIDTTQGTNTNRAKIYINGSQVTSLGTATYCNQNVDISINTNSYRMAIGAGVGNGDVADGYAAETVFIDGTAYAADSFGEFDSDSAIWKPINVSGLTFGTNGFYLDFEDSANLGNDANGGTDLTEVNLAATDQSTDTCTNNYCTINPLDNYYSAATFSEGNIKVSSARYAGVTSTFALTKGKWYFEYKCVSRSNTSGFVGITSATATATNYEFGNQSGANVGYSVSLHNGSVYGNGGQVAAAGTFETIEGGDFGMVALDFDNNKIYYGKDGTWGNSQNPENGTNALSIVAVTQGASGYWRIYVGGETNNATVFEMNFGSPPYAISSGNTDGNGYGNFEYAVPSGYYALNTKNLAEYG
jgi:hypothetical protein